MDIVFNCTNCGQALAVPSRMAGHEVSCSSCGAVLTAPAVAPSNSRRQTILAIGTLAAILLIGSVVAFLVLRPGRNQSKATADTAEASSAAPTREETPMEVVTKAANRLAATNHSWLLTFPLDRKDENPLLKSFGNVEGETDGLITYGKISLGISDLQFAYTPTKVAILQKGKWIVVADDGDEKLGQIRVHKSAGALAQYL